MLFPDQLGPARIPGFSHVPQFSKFFRSNEVVSVEDDGVVRKEIGPNGVFVHYANGYSAGIPNARAPSFQAGPYSNDVPTHHARVLAYFKSAGLPADQVGSTSVNTWMREGGPMQEMTPQGPVAKAVVAYRELIGHVSIISRVVEGVRVADSFAWAMFNKNDEVVAEQVWWPELRDGLVAEVKAFKSALGPSFRAKLPVELAQTQGELVIHHANPTGEKWYSTVSYDVNQGQEMRHFDASGAQVSFNSPLG